jgi:Resolvase, N terminal domain
VCRKGPKLTNLPVPPSSRIAHVVLGTGWAAPIRRALASKRLRFRQKVAAFAYDVVDPWPLSEARTISHVNARKGISARSPNVLATRSLPCSRRPRRAPITAAPSAQDLVQTLDGLHGWKVSVLAQTGLTSGKLMRTIMAGLAKFERDLTRDRVKSEPGNGSRQGHQTRSPGPASVTRTRRSRGSSGCMPMGCPIGSLLATWD